MGTNKIPGIDEVRVQDKQTKLVRTMNRRAYELKPNRYILLRDGEKTDEEIAAEEKQELADLRVENAALKQELAHLKLEIQGPIPKIQGPMLPPLEDNTETSTIEASEPVAPAEGEATEQDAVRRGPGRPKKAE